MASRRLLGRVVELLELYNLFFFQLLKSAQNIRNRVGFAQTGLMNRNLGASFLAPVPELGLFHVTPRQPYLGRCGQMRKYPLHPIFGLLFLALLLATGMPVRSADPTELQRDAVAKIDAFV